MPTARPLPPVYWSSPVGEWDDFGRPIGTTPGSKIYDAATQHRGMWALMSEESYRIERCYATLGLGRGQEYTLQEDGRWLKTGG